MKRVFVLFACLCLLSACSSEKRSNTGPTLYPDAAGGTGHGGNTGAGTR